MIPSFWHNTLSMPAYDKEAFEQRRRNQITATQGHGNLLNFRFKDHSQASRITFDNPAPTPENIELYHYDHLGSMASADVNGDGHLDLLFTSLAGANQLWLNKGSATFVLSPYNDSIALKGQSSAAASFGDFNNDGRPDLVITTVKHGIHLFENIGRGKFKDISPNLGPLPLRHSSAATFFDFNNDGRLDLYVANVGKFTKDRQFSDGTFETIENAFAGAIDPTLNETPFLFRNIGGNRFVEVSKEVGLHFRAWNGDVLVNDLNRDGYQDLYVMNMMGPNLFFLNDKGQRFTDVTGQYFPKLPFGVMGGQFFDFNNDGHTDLFLTDMHIDMGPVVFGAREAQLESEKTDPKSLSFLSENGGEQLLKQMVLGNSFHKNWGDGKFTEISDNLNLENYWPWGVSVGDVNADGYEDVFISSGMGLPFRYGVSSLKVNSLGEKFVDAEFVSGIEPHREPMAAYFNLECEGKNSAHSWCAYCASVESKNDARCAERDDQKRHVVRGATSDRSSVLVDLNNDGALDLVLSEFKGPPLVFLNDLAQKQKVNWLKIKFKGTKSNREGLGANVKISLDNGRELYRSHDGKSGYLAQSSLPLYFGLGKAKIKSILVSWPSGRVQRIDGSKIAINRTLEITEP